MTPILIDKHEAAIITGYAANTLQKKRDVGDLTEGIHYVRRGKTSIAYLKKPLEIWSKYFYSDRAAYNRAMDIHLQGEESNQKKSGRR